MNENLKPYEDKIKEIFTLDKLPAILAVINSLRTPYGEWIKEDQFKTLVHIGGVDAMDKLQKSLTQFVINNSSFPGK